MLSGCKDERGKDQHINENISRNLFILWLAASQLLSPLLGLEQVAGNETWNYELGWRKEVAMGTDNANTWGLVQVFMWGSLRIKTVEGVEGRGRKMLKVVGKQISALCF